MAVPASEARDVAARDRRLGRRRAFTAVEILIVITILAIMASLVWPLVGAADASRLQGAAERLVSDLALAQIESMVNGDDPRLLVVAPGGSGYSIAASSDPGTPLPHPASGRPLDVRFGEGAAAELAGVAITGHTLGGDDELAFAAYGQLDQATEARLTLGAGDWTVTITIDPDTGEAVVGPVERLTRRR